MKFKTTKKAIKDNYYTIISIGYCQAQNLLKGKTALAYSTRREGWACDYYELKNNTIISTGYAPLAAKNTIKSYDIVKKYDLKAEAINHDYALTWDQKCKKIEKLLNKFIDEVTIS